MNEEFGDELDFGPFRLDITRRTLTRDGRRIALAGKAFDTLVFLAKNAGKTLTRDEILDAVWHETAVEENNLSQQISVLRKLLGDTPGNHRYIVTVPGVGYRFIANVALAGPKRWGNLAFAAFWTRYDLGHALAVCFILLFSMPVVINGIAGGTRRTQTVAVLTFSSQGDDAAISAGITNTLRARLGSVEDIAVRPSVPEVTDPLIAGRDLGVETVLTGSVQREDDRIRVTVEMIDVSGSRIVWGRTFDDEAGSIFEMQDRISKEVAARLGVRLLGSRRIAGASRS